MGFYLNKDFFVITVRHFLFFVSLKNCSILLHSFISNKSRIRSIMVVDGSKAETMTEQKSTNSEISSDDVEALATDYLKNMGNGKKNLLCGDFPEAVACFQLACSQQSERFGETSHECAESFHYYGKALLELARMENGVLGNALKGVPETEDESESEVEEPQFEKPNIPAEERQEIRKEVEDAMKETESESEENQATDDEKMDEKETEEKKVENKKDEEKKVEEKKDEEKNNEEATEDVSMETEVTVEAKNGTSGKSEAGGSSSSSAGKKDTEEAAEKDDEEEADENDGEDTEDPEDIPNMQLAWEMLELSKVLYSKKPSDKQNKLMIANCHLKLGELGLEVENYAQSIGDFLECLVIRKELLDSYDRSLAETHYQLGLAYAFDKRYDNALEHYNQALEVLDTRIEHLNKIIDEKDREEKDATAEPHPECTEIGEIKALIPDINSKIEDVEVMKRQESKFAGSPFRNSDGAGSSSSSAGTTTIGFAQPSTPTEKICTVIPIKRKDDEKSEEEKKPATTENGSSTTTAATNDISHLVRRKRASDNDDVVGAAETKKIKTAAIETVKADDATNGTAEKKNGADEAEKKPAENAEAPKEVSMEA